MMLVLPAFSGSEVWPAEQSAERFTAWSGAPVFLSASEPAFALEAAILEYPADFRFRLAGGEDLSIGLHWLLYQKKGYWH